MVANQTPARNSEPVFRKAVRSKAWLKMALTGPSNGGKTYSSLLIASGIGGRIAVIDTENGSSELYAGYPGMPEFDVVHIDAPYLTDKYKRALNVALREKYDVVILDSISHAWQGDGGIMQRKDEVDSRGGKGETNRYTNWAQFTKEHEAFKAAMLQADCHLIATMRSKTEYVMGEGNKPIKVGMAPIQRDGMEYEFSLLLDIQTDHKAKASKDRTGLFGDEIFMPSAETGRRLVEWLNGGAGDLARREPPLSPEEEKRMKWKRAMDKLHVVGAETGYDHEELHNLSSAVCDVHSMNDLTIEQMTKLAAICRKTPRKKAPPVSPSGHPVGSAEDIRSAANETADSTDERAAIQSSDGPPPPQSERG